MSTDQPDCASIAGKFDLWLPHLAPVGEILLRALAARTGDHIIDIGSGTGEPALTLARRMRDQVDITGIDSAGPMAAVAQEKVEREGLTSVRFSQMRVTTTGIPWKPRISSAASTMPCPTMNAPASVMRSPCSPATFTVTADCAYPTNTCSPAASNSLTRIEKLREAAAST